MSPLTTGIECERRLTEFTSPTNQYTSGLTRDLRIVFYFCRRGLGFLYVNFTLNMESNRRFLTFFVVRKVC